VNLEYKRFCTELTSKSYLCLTRVSELKFNEKKGGYCFTDGLTALRGSATTDAGQTKVVC
jgi:hypothetical protein